MSAFVGEESSRSGACRGGSGIQRKNLMNAKLLDNEVQQEIYPEHSHDEGIRNISLSDNSAVGGEMSARVRAQDDAVQDLDSALGDLSLWRDAMKEQGDSLGSSGFIEGNQDAKYAKLVAFVDEALSSKAKVRSSGSEEEELHDRSHARLQALSKRKDLNEAEEGNLSTIVASNAELAHMRSSFLGKNYMGLNNLEATKNQLIAELEMDELHIAELEKRINSECWDEIDAI